MIAPLVLASLAGAAVAAPAQNASLTFLSNVTLPNGTVTNATFINLYGNETLLIAPANFTRGGNATFRNASAWKNVTTINNSTGMGRTSVQVGERPFYLIDRMADSPLKRRLESCSSGPFYVNDFTIGHRGGATLFFPEETVENEKAGAQQGAGVLECDVTFTSDKKLVCRHSQCDLHTTTDILLRPELAKKCSIPFQPANGTKPATAMCCTSDITVEEYKTLCGKQDGFNASATTAYDYQNGTPDWRTNLYEQCNKLMTFDSYIDLVNGMPGYRSFTPELKEPLVPMPFKNMTQQDYAQAMIDTLKEHNIAPNRVYPQSFHIEDIYYWIDNEPEYGRRAVFLDESDTPAAINASIANFTSYKKHGLTFLAPSIPMLITVGKDNRTIVPTEYAKQAKAAGFELFAWTFERSGPLRTVKARDEYYFSSIVDILYTDGQYYEALDALAFKVGIKGLFTDWASSVTYFANCFNLTGPSSVKFAGESINATAYSNSNSDYLTLRRR